MTDSPLSTTVSVRGMTPAVKQTRQLLPPVKRRKKKGGKREQ